MNTALETLLSASGDPLFSSWRPDDESLLSSCGQVGKELIELLRRKNGFFAFESSLHVFPLGQSHNCISLPSWNDQRTWRGGYGALVASDLVFFAQDAFGNQFAMNQKGVFLFYSEFAELEPIGSSLGEWGQALIDDWRGYTGFELSHQWQVKNQPLKEGERLIPKVPFILGGKYEVANLYAGRIIEAMRFRASLALQVAALPDGTPVNLKIVQKPE
jgi:hypothetical protein